jgi:hypothetical protein
VGVGKGYLSYLFPPNINIFIYFSTADIKKHGKHVYSYI